MQLARLRLSCLIDSMSVNLRIYSARTPHPSVVLELLKPITWFPPMWAYLCGVVSAGPLPDGAWP